jgi:flagellin
MRELAVQGANDTNGTADRTNIRKELTELHEEIDAIKNQTKWAGNTLISGASTFVFQIGDEKAETLTVATTAILANTLSVGATEVAKLTNQGSFTAFISLVNDAIADISGYRAEYGANSNRLDHVMSNLATNAESVKASLGRIEDTDYAAETTELAKSQILQQAATSMLAQANASKQTILSLIQG